MVRPARLLWLLVGVLLVAVLPSIAGAADFKCEEHALDLSVCSDPKDLDTCPQGCSPSDPKTCAPLPLPVLLSTQRQTATQPILRQVTVQEGPFLGVTLTLSTFSVTDDNVFSRGRNFLCVPTTTTPPDDGSGSSGGVSAGLNPGLIGGDPGLSGGDPRVRGGSSGLR